MKKIISLLLSVVMIFTTCFGFSATAFAEEGIKCGDNIYATFDAKASTLYIEGSGDMYNYNASTTPPPQWTANLADIKTIDIAADIDRIGNRAFYGCINASKIIVRNAGTVLGDQDTVPKNDGLTIYSFNNSNAKEYASEFGFNFDLLHWITFQRLNGTTYVDISRKVYPNGTLAEDIDVPDLQPVKPTNPSDDLRHSIYFWTFDGTSNIPVEIGSVTGEVTYKERRKLVSCDFGDDSNAQYCLACGKANPNYCAHENIEFHTIDATCDTNGYKNAAFCKDCGRKISNGEEIPATGHSYAQTVIAPTCTAWGYTIYTCTVCGFTFNDSFVNETPHSFGNNGTNCSVCGIANPNYVVPTPPVPTPNPASELKVTLSTTTYTYSGKVRKPSVTVKDSNGKKISSRNYSVSYAKGRKYVGKYAVKVKFKGNYSGTKTVYFTIKPKSTSISSLKAGKKKFTVKWKKQASQTSGYVVQYSTSSKFKSAKTVAVSGYKNTSKTVSKLKAKKKYYVRVRTYKTVKINGKPTKIYSSWSKVKSVTVKK